jgi:hypothetical protein
MATRRDEVSSVERAPCSQLTAYRDGRPPRRLVGGVGPHMHALISHVIGLYDGLLDARLRG